MASNPQLWLYATTRVLLQRVANLEKLSGPPGIFFSADLVPHAPPGYHAAPSANVNLATQLRTLMYEAAAKFKLSDDEVLFSNPDAKIDDLTSKIALMEKAVGEMGQSTFNPHASVFVPREKLAKKVHFDDDGDHFHVPHIPLFAGNTSDDEDFLVEQMEQQMDSQSYRDYIKFLEGSDDEVENFDDLCTNLAKVKIRWYTKELTLLNDIVDEPDAASEASSSDYWLSRDILLERGYDLNAESDEALDELFDHVRLEPEFLARKRAKDEAIS